MKLQMLLDLMVHLWKGHNTQLKEDSFVVAVVDVAVSEEEEDFVVDHQEDVEMTIMIMMEDNKWIWDEVVVAEDHSIVVQDASSTEDHVMTETVKDKRVKKSKIVALD